MQSLKTWLKETLIKDLFHTSTRPKKANGSYEWSVLGGKIMEMELKLLNLLRAFLCSKIYRGRFYSIKNSDTSIPIFFPI